MHNKSLFKIMIMVTAILFVVPISVSAVSRERCVTIIVQNSSIDSSNTNEDLLDKYVDGKNIEKESRKKYICAALENGIVRGYEDGTLRLNEDITRAEFACMIYRAKDFYESHPLDQTIKYNGKYDDVSGWNEEEILYCLENGYLMGYGDKFGSNDLITGEQIDIVINRIKYGLSTREKYSLYDVCGFSPISMKEVLNSVDSDEIRNYKFETSHPEENVYESNNNEIALNLEKLLEIMGNMDYKKLQNDDYKRKILDNFKGIGYAGNSINIQIFDGSEYQSIEEKIKEAEDNKIIRESIVVISPENNKKSSFYTAFNRSLGVGYEFYCYKNTDKGTPNGEKIGVWYKRRIVVDFTQNITASSRYATMKCNYGIFEEI